MKRMQAPSERQTLAAIRVLARCLALSEGADCLTTAITLITMAKDAAVDREHAPCACCVEAARRIRAHGRQLFGAEQVH